MHVKSLQPLYVVVICVVLSFHHTGVVATVAHASEASARMVPHTPQPAGTVQSVRFEVVLGARGMRPGGSLRLEWGHWRPAREFNLEVVKVTANVPDAEFEVSVPPKRKHWPPEVPPTIVTFKRGGPLVEGSKVVVVAQMRYAKYTNVAAQLRLTASCDTDDKPAGVAEWTLQAVAGPLAEIRCIAEARPVADQPARLVVAATDRFGNPATASGETVHLTCNTKTNLPAAYTFTDDDNGSHFFGVHFPIDRVSRVQAKWDNVSVMSNPILPRQVDEPAILFGDIHSHCEISADAVGDPDAAYDYARRFWGLDFAALSDHSPRGRQWERAVAAANRSNRDGSFATLLAFEWSSSDFGHRNIYYRDDAGPQQPRLPDNMTSWWDWLDQRELRALVVPHHTNTESVAIREDGSPVWRAADWSVVNHKYQRLVEICQNRGSFEAPGGPNAELHILRKDCGASAQAALARGHRLGFFGSTDTHSGRPGTGQARCAVLAPELSRGAVWDALHARHCYGTTGAHIILLFHINDHLAGSEVKVAGPDATRNITWRAIGTGKIKRVDLLRNNLVTKQWHGQGRNDISATCEHSEPIGETEWWYLRVIQEDGQLAWSSPIWNEPVTAP